MAVRGFTHFYRYFQIFFSHFQTSLKLFLDLFLPQRNAAGECFERKADKKINIRYIISGYKLVLRKTSRNLFYMFRYFGQRWARGGGVLKNEVNFAKISHENSQQLQLYLIVNDNKLNRELKFFIQKKEWNSIIEL